MHDAYENLQGEEKEKASMHFLLDALGEDQETDNPEEFAKSEITRDLIAIKMHLRSYTKSIWIAISTYSFIDESYYNVEGTDKLWVDGITRQLFKIFHKHQTTTTYSRYGQEASISTP